MKHFVSAALFLLPTLAAQTFVVDTANGPGTNFTSLPAAVAAVPDGAVLIVRAGGYLGFAMAGKGLTVLCDPGVALTGGIAVANTAANQAVTLRRVTWTTQQTTAGSALIALTNCAGPVLLEQIEQPPHQTCLPSSPFGQCLRVTGLSATQCAQLCLRDCTMLCTVYLDHCDTVIESCRIEGENWFQAWMTEPGRTALTVWYGKAQIAGNSLLEGGDGWPSGLSASLAGDGVDVFAGDLRLLDGQVVGGSNGFLPASTVYQSGPAQVRISPRVTLLGFGPVGTDHMPALTGTSAPLGGTLSATVATENGDFVGLAVAWPGPALFVPGFQDPFWLDPTAHAFLTIGLQQSGAPITGSLAVPNAANLLGLRLNWQAVCYGPATGLQASNPVVTLVY